MRILYAKPFTATPRVLACISGVDISKSDDSRLFSNNAVAFTF